MMSIRIVLGNGEAIQVALRRLKKRLERAGVTWEMRRRVYFIRGTEQRRAKDFRRRFKTRQAALHVAGLTGLARDAALTKFWRKTGKP